MKTKLFEALLVERQQHDSSPEGCHEKCSQQSKGPTGLDRLKRLDHGKPPAAR